MDKRANGRKTLTGVVISDKMMKTRVVQVTTVQTHSQYGKQVRVHNKYKAHDENNEARMGDEVALMETRPLSKDKRWVITAIVKKAVSQQEVSA
ncbi:MAG: 30S ribosomal protein S17 [Elusimicrobia bacterium]|nr:30S ribosomal protein S17 [Elusimicrobiota bacterium]